MSDKTSELAAAERAEKTLNQSITDLQGLLNSQDIDTTGNEIIDHIVNEHTSAITALRALTKGEKL